MPQTFYLGATNSDLTGGADWNKYLEDATETSGTLSTTVAAGATEVSRAFTRAGVPGTNVSPDADEYTIEVGVTTGNAAIFLALQLHRINSAGTIQTSSSISGEAQLDGPAVKNFSFSGLSLGTWVAGDRLRVDYRFRSTSGEGNQTVTIRTGTTDTEHTIPVAAILGRSADARTLVGVG